MIQADTSAPTNRIAAGSIQSLKSTGCREQKNVIRNECLMLKEVHSVKLIDKYLPSWDYGKVNKILLNYKSVPNISIIYHADFGKSKIIRTLFFLRGLPAKMLKIDDFIETGFILLEENNKEIVIGLVAQPWKATGNIMKMSPVDFNGFDKPDYVKVAWNFLIEEIDEEEIRISTETRIHCTSGIARKYFSVYWFFISYFSSVIRNEMLKIIGKEISKVNV